MQGRRGDDIRASRRPYQDNSRPCRLECKGQGTSSHPCSSLWSCWTERRLVTMEILGQTASSEKWPSPKLKQGRLLRLWCARRRSRMSGVDVRRPCVQSHTTQVFGPSVPWESPQKKVVTMSTMSSHWSTECRIFTLSPHAQHLSPLASHTSLALLVDDLVNTWYEWEFPLVNGVCAYHLGLMKSHIPRYMRNKISPCPVCLCRLASARCNRVQPP